MIACIHAIKRTKEGIAISAIRKSYMLRFGGRCVVLVACVWLCIAHPEQLSVLQGGAFFRQFSALHVLWAIWMLDMAAQLHPAKKSLSLGSKKLFAQYFRPSQIRTDLQALKRYIVSTTCSAYRILLLWVALIAALGFCHFRGWLSDAALFMTSVLFYVCDLICVLFWCPFRLLLKNRCCTTCRIFNWDHILMFTPMLFVHGFFAYSLLAVALVVWVAWELSVILHPERFWWQSNETLQCVNCTDKLCTQYCRKLRPRQNQL